MNMTTEDFVITEESVRRRNLRKRVIIDPIVNQANKADSKNRELLNELNTPILGPIFKKTDEQQKIIQHLSEQQSELKKNFEELSARNTLAQIMIERLDHLIRKAFSGLNAKQDSFSIIRNILMVKCWSYFAEAKWDTIVKDLETELSQQFKTLLEESTFWSLVGAIVQNSLNFLWQPKHIYWSPQLKKIYQSEKGRVQLEKYAVTAFEKIFKFHNLKVSQNKFSYSHISHSLTSCNDGSKDQNLKEPTPTSSTVPAPEIKNEPMVPEVQTSPTLEQNYDTTLTL